MDKINYRIVWLLVLLVTCNLALTIYLVARPTLVTTTTSTATTPAVAGATPADEPVISDAKANSLAKEIIALYNKNDAAGLYARMDNLARVQFSQKQLTEQLHNLHKMMGEVGNSAYTHTETAGKRQDGTFYTLHYNIALSGGNYTHGTLKLTYVKKTDGPGLVGFSIKSIN